MTKLVGARIEHAQVWEEFKAFVRRRHGQLNYALGRELERAIVNHMETSNESDHAPARTHTDRDAITEDHGNNGGHLESPGERKTEQIIDRLVGCGAWRLDALPIPVVRRFVKEVAGHDHGTIAKYAHEIAQRHENGCPTPLARS
jgi:hypothetical protein